MALPRAEQFGRGTAKSRVTRLWDCQEHSNSVAALPMSFIYFLKLILLIETHLHHSKAFIILVYRYDLFEIEREREREG